MINSSNKLYINYIFIVIIIMSSCSCCSSIGFPFPFSLTPKTSSSSLSSYPHRFPTNRSHVFDPSKEIFCKAMSMKAGGPLGNKMKPINSNKSNEPLSFKKVFIRNSLGIWGAANVLAILANAIKRLFPVAMQPFINKDMLPIHWGLYGLWCIFMGYFEGYKAFHLKFAPMVVHRAFHLNENVNLLNILLAGPYSMGLFAASRKRMIVSWSITVGVFALITIVKQLPYPYRSIVDAGVVVGLSLGSLSIVWNSVWAMFGIVPKNSDDDDDDENKRSAGNGGSAASSSTASSSKKL